MSFLILQIEMDHFICHEDLLVHMRSVAGMLRDKTPKKLDGTVGQDIQKMIRTFRSGMTVQVSLSIFNACRPRLPWRIFVIRTHV